MKMKFLNGNLNIFYLNKLYGILFSQPAIELRNLINCGALLLNFFTILQDTLVFLITSNRLKWSIKYNER